MDAVDGGLADDRDVESDYGQTDQALVATMVQHPEHEWAVALNEEEGIGIEEQEQEQEQKQEEQEQERMEREK